VLSGAPTIAERHLVWIGRNAAGHPNVRSRVGRYLADIPQISVGNRLAAIEGAGWRVRVPPGGCSARNRISQQRRSNHSPTMTVSPKSSETFRRPAEPQACLQLAARRFLLYAIGT
jgi:hypothetical protein